MSTLLFALSAANKKLPEAWLVIASPVYTEPAERTAISVELGKNPDHPLIVPSREAKRNSEVQFSILNSEEPLYTIPVGDPGPVPDEEGTITCRVCGLPLPSYSVDQPSASSLIQNAPPGA